MEITSYSLKAKGIEIPKLSRIAFFHNGTEHADYIGNLTILIGNKKPEDTGRIVRWRGLDEVPFWLTKWGRMLNGTDGTITPPSLTPKSKIWFFMPELCRSVQLVYEKDVKAPGVGLYRFHFSDDLFANITENPDNIAFCSDNQTCWPRGLLPLSKCLLGGPPILVSPPHFYNSHPDLVKHVDGMKPERRLHDTVVDVEPITGTVMKTHKRIQINVMARKFWLKVTQDLKYNVNVLPLVIREENIAVDNMSTDYITSKVSPPKKVLSYVQYTLIGLSGCVLLIALAAIISYKSRTIHVSPEMRNECCATTMKPFLSMKWILTT